MDPQNPTNQPTSGQTPVNPSPQDPVDGFLPPANQPTPTPAYGTPSTPLPSNPVTNPSTSDAPARLEPLQPIAQTPNSPISDPDRDQVIQELKDATNVLVTVSNNPSVDQLAAAIGITLVLNKLNKHATAVFSGNVPSILEFLKPEKTLEKNTDSLRDFIIALDKSKADKLRYKIEDKFVKIFITPYHTSIDEKDLEFSQGDFNVDVVLALGVKIKEELDQAITAHGRILHDATVMSVNNTLPAAQLGSVNWSLSSAGSLSEIMVGVSEALQGQEKVFDSQVSTAFLTGIVAETERFSNSKTSPLTMSIAGKLMDNGANQQLVATKLAEPEPIPTEKEAKPLPKTPVAPPKPIEKPKIPTVAPPATTLMTAKKSDGSLAVPHPKESHPKAKTLSDLEQMIAEDEQEDDDLDKIHIDDQGTLRRLEEMKAEEERKKREAEELRGTAAEMPSGGVLPSPVPATDAPGDDKTLEDIEEAVHSPHIDSARENVADAAKDSAEQPEAISALGAQPLGGAIHGNDENGLPKQVIGEDKGLPPDETAGNGSPTAPPPVPPPIVPPPMPPS